MQEPLAGSSLRSREDMQMMAAQLCAATDRYVSPGRARIELPGPRAHYSTTVQGMEGWCRRLWGLAPLIAGGGAWADQESLREGLVNGCDATHPEYWGVPDDFDQRLVESAAISCALLTAPSVFWHPLSRHQQRAVAAYLGMANTRDLHDTNWRLFRVMANVALLKLDAPHSRRQLSEDLDRIESFYVGGGWYSDGPHGPCDYYSSWAIQFYCLLYAVHMQSEDPLRAARFRERAAIFAGAFINWFAPDGAAVPFGRSLTYRFSQVAFWGALAVAGVEAMSWGVVKGIVLRNLRWWLQHPILADGLLTVGYGYPNTGVIERYSSSCSPYWALKAFLPLALPATAPFWTEPEEPLPGLAGVCAQPEAGIVICRDGNHVFALSAARHVPARHHGSAEKYAKFCYSTRHGFSVSSGLQSGTSGAYDSMLAVSTGGDTFRVRRCSDASDVVGELIVSEWSPSPGISVKTWLIPMLPWQVHVHCLRTTQSISTAEAGFAVAIEEPGDRWSDQSAHQPREMAAARTSQAMVAIVDLHGVRRPVIVQADPNTNVLFRRSVIPTLIGHHAKGEHWLAAAIVSLQAAAPGNQMPHVPRFHMVSDGFEVSTAAKRLTVTVPASTPDVRT